MKKVLITGNSGYIGSHLTKLLLNDYIVHGLDIVEPQVQPNVQHHIDIRKMFTLDESYDSVIHLAALTSVGESEKFPIPYYITNLNGTMNVVNKIKTSNFIFASTGTAENCVSVYGTSKRAAEDIIKDYYNNHRPTPYTIFRFYNVIGSDGFIPTNSDSLMFNLLKAKDTGSFFIYGNDYDVSNDGTCVRDYVHVNEICESIKLAIEKPSNSTECLGHGVGYTVKEIAELFRKVNNLDFEIHYRPRRKGDIPSSVLENTSSYMVNLYNMADMLKLS